MSPETLMYVHIPGVTSSAKPLVSSSDASGALQSYQAPFGASSRLSFNGGVGAGGFGMAPMGGAASPELGVGDLSIGLSGLQITESRSLNAVAGKPLKFKVVVFQKADTVKAKKQGGYVAAVQYEFDGTIIAPIDIQPHRDPSTNTMTASIMVKLENDNYTVSTGDIVDGALSGSLTHREEVNARSGIAVGA